MNHRLTQGEITMQEKQGFTTGEVADLCCVTIPTVIKWMESGKLKGFRIPCSTNRRVTRDNLVDFMKRSGIPTSVLEKKYPKVLIVDSDTKSLDSFSNFFRGIFEIRLARKGFEAGLAKEFVPKVVLLNLSLPDLDAKKVCKYIRTMPEMKTVKIFAIANSEKEVPKKALQDGFDDVFVKPLDNNQILRKIQKLMS